MKCKETLEAGTARGFHYCTETDEHDIHHCHCGRLWTTENNESGILVFRIKDAIEIRGTATNEESIQQFFSEVRAALDLDREASPQTESPSPSGHFDSIKLPPHNDYGDPCTHREAYEKVMREGNHTRRLSYDPATDQPSPDVCAECSSAVSEWVEWPCAGWEKAK
jgi:hypothetical protein